MKRNHERQDGTADAEKDTCKDILDRVKEVLGSERHVRNIFNRVWRLSLLSHSNYFS